jgi:hypothetical protein
MNLHSYPKVYNIGHRAIAELFLDPVLVEEKVDGSQFSFAKINGQLLFRSRGAEIFANSPKKMFKAAVNSVLEIADLLRDGWVYRGEYLAKPKHNVLAYQRVPLRNVILFDVNTGDEVYLDRDAKEFEAERLGMEVVPVVFSGQVKTPEQLLSFLERESVLGGQKVEGIVVKNYSRFGLDKKALMGKFVREDFKETHSKQWKADNLTTGDVIGRLIAVLKNEKRWEKGVQHLRERGALQNAPQDIGPLLKEIQRDIQEEESEFIKEKLFEFALPHILRASTAGCPEWYKRRLLESAFSVENSGADNQVVDGGGAVQSG